MALPATLGAPSSDGRRTALHIVEGQESANNQRRCSSACSSTPTPPLSSAGPAGLILVGTGELARAVSPQQVARRRVELLRGVGVVERGGDAAGEHLAQLDAPLVERVDAEEPALHGDAVLVERNQPAARARVEPPVEEQAERRPVTGARALGPRGVERAERERIGLREEVGLEEEDEEYFLLTDCPWF